MDGYVEVYVEVYGGLYGVYGDGMRLGLRGWMLGRVYKADGLGARLCEHADSDPSHASYVARPAAREPGPS